MISWLTRHELRVTAEELWLAVRDGVAPDRPEAQPRPPQGVLLPHSLVRALLAAGYGGAYLRGVTLEEAKELLERLPEP